MFVGFLLSLYYFLFVYNNKYYMAIDDGLGWKTFLLECRLKEESFYMPWKCIQKNLLLGIYYLKSKM